MVKTPRKLQKRFYQPKTLNRTSAKSLRGEGKRLNTLFKQLNTPHLLPLIRIHTTHDIRDFISETNRSANANENASDGLRVLLPRPKRRSAGYDAFQHLIEPRPAGYERYARERLPSMPRLARASVMHGHLQRRMNALLYQRGKEGIKWR
jgi:hypothetical protein